MGVKYVAEAEFRRVKVENAGLPYSARHKHPTGIPEADQYNFQLVYDTGSDDRGNMVSASEGIIFVEQTQPARSGRWSKIAKSYAHLGKSLPARWTHLIEKEALRVKELEHSRVEKSNYFFETCSRDGCFKINRSCSLSLCFLSPS